MRRGVSVPIITPSRSTASRFTSHKYSPNLTCWWHCVPHQPRSIIAAKCISIVAQSWCPCKSVHLLHDGVRVHLPTNLIIKSKCICEFTSFGPPRGLSNSHYKDLQIHLKFHMILVTWHSRTLTASQETHWRDRFLSEEIRKRVIGYDVVPGSDKTHKLSGSLTAHQECFRNASNHTHLLELIVGTRTAKDAECNLYNKMMTMYSGVSQILSPHCRVDRHYLSISAGQ